jgi:predicted transcriptional regulator/uncharacterized membrane protein
MVLAKDCDNNNSNSRESSPSFTVEMIFNEQVKDQRIVLYPGNYYNLNLRLTNTGDVNDTYQLAIIGIPSGWLVGFPEITEMDVDLNAVAYGQNAQDIFVQIKVPDSAEKGNYPIQFKATSVLSANTQSQTLTVSVNYMPPHILLGTKETDKEVEPGGTPANFEIEVKNLGFDTVTYYPPEEDEFILPTDWTIEIQVAGEPIQIEPADSRNFDVNISVPDDAGVQEWVKLEIKGFTTSTNSTIIPVELFVRVKQIHKIDIIAPSSQLVLQPFKEIFYDLKVENNGNGPENLKFGLDLPEGTENWNIHLSGSTHTVPAGSHHLITLNYTPPLDAKNDFYELDFLVDIMDSSTVIQTETFTTINEIRYVPDLTIYVSDIQFSDFYLESAQTISINATVHNVGIGPALDVSVEFIMTSQAGSQKTIGTAQLDQVPSGGSTIATLEWEVDPATSSIMVVLDPQNKTFEINEKNNYAVQSVFIIQPSVTPPKESSGGGAGVASIGTLGAVIVLTALISITSVMVIVTLNTEAGRYGFLTFFFPLYTKVRREDVLMHETREMVYDYVKSHPGDHFRAIMSKLSLTNGTLAHHLYTLEKQEFIKSERDGPYKRFYPKGYKFMGSVMEVNGIQKKILDVIEENPGISQKRVAHLLSVSPPTVNYHIKTLTGARLVDLQRNGKETRCYRIQAE